MGRWRWRWSWKKLETTGNGSCVVMGYHLAHAQALASLTTVGSFSASCSLIGSQLSWSYHRAGNQPSQRLQGHDRRLAHWALFLPWRLPGSLVLGGGSCARTAACGRSWGKLLHAWQVPLYMLAVPFNPRIVGRLKLRLNFMIIYLIYYKSYLFIL